MLIIRDDYSQPWYFTGHSIESIFGDESFPCNSWEEGIQILNYQGYLDGAEYEVLDTGAIDAYME